MNAYDLLKSNGVALADREQVTTAVAADRLAEERIAAVRSLRAVRR
jgi:hypothetical protein